MNRRIVSAVAAIALVALIASSASAQTGIGLRYGSFTPEGDYIDMEASSVFGAHVALGFIPVLKFQLGAEYLSGTADYHYPGGLDLANQDYQSIAIFADVRYPIQLLPLFPIKPMVGAGMNINLMTYMDEATVEDVVLRGMDPDPADFTKTGYHIMVGLLFKPPILPFSISVEYRIQKIKLEDETVSNNGVLFGLTYGF